MADRCKIWLKKAVNQGTKQIREFEFVEYFHFNGGNENEKEQKI